MYVCNEKKWIALQIITDANPGQTMKTMTMMTMMLMIVMIEEERKKLKMQNALKKGQLLLLLRVTV